jgi:hypothetical protein
MEDLIQKQHNDEPNSSLSAETTTVWGTQNTIPHIVLEQNMNASAIQSMHACICRTTWIAGTRSTVSSQHRTSNMHHMKFLGKSLFQLVTCMLWHIVYVRRVPLMLFIYLAFSSMYASMEQTEIYWFIGQRNKVPTVNFDPVINTKDVCYSYISTFKQWVSHRPIS